MLIQALSSAPTGVSVNEVVDDFNEKCTDVIDATAPTKVKVVSGQKRSPRRNATSVRTERRAVEEMNAGGEKQISIYKERQTWRGSVQLLCSTDLEQTPREVQDGCNSQFF